MLAALEPAPSHGDGVVRSVRSRSGGRIHLAGGTVYPMLHRLERDGLVVSRWSPERGRRRRVYRVTCAGHEALRVRDLEWRTFAAAW